MEYQNKSVIIGKFPLDYTEEQIIEIAKSIGPIINIKLLFDENTGKSKGYSVIVYKDYDLAESAVRNLNYMVLPNGRFLKCSFFNNQNSLVGSTNLIEEFFSLPLGTQIYGNQNHLQIISNVVSNIDSKNAYQTLNDIKSMCIENEELTKTLFDRFPQLSHALVELSLITNVSSRKLVELTLNKKKPELKELSIDHVNLLKEITLLTDEEISNLDEDKINVFTKLKKEIENGSFGEIS